MCSPDHQPGVVQEQIRQRRHQQARRLDILATGHHSDLKRSPTARLEVAARLLLGVDRVQNQSLLGIRHEPAQGCQIRSPAPAVDTWSGTVERRDDQTRRVGDHDAPAARPPGQPRQERPTTTPKPSSPATGAPSGPALRRYRRRTHASRQQQRGLTPGGCPASRRLLVLRSPWPHIRPACCSATHRPLWQ